MFLAYGFKAFERVCFILTIFCLLVFCVRYLFLLFELIYVNFQITKVEYQVEKNKHFQPGTDLQIWELGAKAFFGSPLTPNQEMWLIG